MPTSFLTLALVLAGVPVGVAAQTATTATTSSERPATTPSGTTFTVAAGWTMTTKDRLVELAAPEGDLTIALVEVGPAADAKAAAAAAWAAWTPAAARPPKLVTPRAARNGWHEQQVVDYETSPNEKRVMQASALRRGTAWTVLLIDGSEATAEKRGAAGGLMFASVRPAGYTKETFAGKTAQPMDAARIAQLKAFVEQAMKELGVPGAAFALTDRKRTFYATGLGVRELGKPGTATPDSEFMIASNTKGMSTLLLAKLVDEGKLEWDQPVTAVYPQFRLGSPATTSKVLVKHLVCACTGLPRKDMQWLFNTSAKTPASDTFAQLAATEPTSGFGEVFQYNNLMASAAGYVGGYIVHPELELGAAYDRAMDEKVFKPLGMTATTFDFARAEDGDWARPHGDGLDGAPVPMGAAAEPFNRAVGPYRPAGGAWSTANDLIKYVRFELNEGKLDDGRQWVSAPNLLARREIGVSTGENQYYGMGLETDRRYGVDVIHHGGSMFGYKSDILLIPSAGIGGVLLTNADNGRPLLRAFGRRLLELLYEGRPEAAGDVAATAARFKAEYAAERKTWTVPADRAVIAALAPAYENPELGRLTVDRSGAEPLLRGVTVNSKLATKRNDDGTVSLITIDPTLLGFPLVVGSAEGKRFLTARDSQHEYRFVETK